MKRKVRAALETLLEEPELGDPLRDELAGLRRIRVGRLRVVYRLRRGVLEIVAVGSRATIYEDLVARERRSLPSGRSRE